MKRKQFNKKSRRRPRYNPAEKGFRKKLFSKRMGGILKGSVLLENRNVTANDLASQKKGQL